MQLAPVAAVGNNATGPNPPAVLYYSQPQPLYQQATPQYQQATPQYQQYQVQPQLPAKLHHYYLSSPVQSKHASSSPKGEQYHC